MVPKKGEVRGASSSNLHPGVFEMIDWETITKIRQGQIKGRNITFELILCNYLARKIS